MSAYPFGGSVLAETTRGEVEIIERAVGSPTAHFFYKLDVRRLNKKLTKPFSHVIIKIQKRKGNDSYDYD